MSAPLDLEPIRAKVTSLTLSWACAPKDIVALISEVERLRALVADARDAYFLLPRDEPGCCIRCSAKPAPVEIVQRERQRATYFCSLACAQSYDFAAEDAKRREAALTDMSGEADEPQDDHCESCNGSGLAASGDTASRCPACATPGPHVHAEGGTCPACGGLYGTHRLPGCAGASA